MKNKVPFDTTNVKVKAVELKSNDFVDYTLVGIASIVISLIAVMLF